MAAHINVSGSSIPPSRAGRPATSRPATSAATVEGLASALNQKLVSKFGDAAKNKTAQDIILQEVSSFLKTPGLATEDALRALEDRVRSRLAGETPIRTQRTLEKKTMLENDEWARINVLQASIGAAEEKKQQERLRSKKSALRTALDEQLKELDERKKLERLEEEEYHRSELAAKQEWDKQEAERQLIQSKIVEHLRKEHHEQLADRCKRREMAAEKRRNEDTQLMNKLAYETRLELEKDIAHKNAAKVALKEFLLQNEDNKRMKEEAKQREWETDRKCMADYAAALDAQDAARQRQLEEFKAKQNRQAAIAATLPPTKRWIDPAVEERYLKEREEAAAAEQQRRLEAVKAANLQSAKALEVQIAEHMTRKRAQQEEQKRAGQQIMAKVREEEEREAAVKLVESLKRQQFKEEIERQMKANALRRQVRPMDETEKKINRQLLKKMEEFKATGAL